MFEIEDEIIYNLEQELKTLKSENEKLRTENNYYSKELGRLHRELNFLKKKMTKALEQRDYYLTIAKPKYIDSERYSCDRDIELIK